MIFLKFSAMITHWILQKIWLPMIILVSDRLKFKKSSHQKLQYQMIFLSTDDVYEVFCKGSSIHLDLTNVHQICVPIGCIFEATGPNDLLQSKMMYLKSSTIILNLIWFQWKIWWQRIILFLETITLLEPKQCMKNKVSNSDSVEQFRHRWTSCYVHINSNWCFSTKLKNVHFMDFVEGYICNCNTSHFAIKQGKHI